MGRSRPEIRALGLGILEIGTEHFIETARLHQIDFRQGDTMKPKTLAAYTLLLIAAGQLWAAQINFTSGTPALAADVNANFTELYNSMWTKTGADLSYSGGNVGIGVASPASALHVNGHGLFDTYNNSAGSPGQVGIRRARGSFGAPSALQSGDEIGYFITRGHDGTGFFNTTIIVSRATENWNASGHGSNMGFLVTPTGSTSYVERLTIAQNGNIGIGTTSPGAKFHLTQTGGTSNDGLRLTGGATNWNTSRARIRFSPAMPGALISAARVRRRAFNFPWRQAEASRSRRLEHWH